MPPDAPSAPRKEAWEREDPAELRRAATEWRQLGYTAYADYLDALARGEKPEHVERPW